jgi:hypothetical protein
MKVNSIKLIIIAAMMIHINLFAFQKVETIDHLLKKELDIQEKILEQILSHHDKNKYIPERDIKGHYIDQYGIVFLVPSPKFGFDYLKTLHAYMPITAPKYEWSQEEASIIKIESKVTKADSLKAKKRVDAIIGSVHAMVFEFLADYFSTVKSLKADENVCVYLRLNLRPKIPIKVDEIFIDSVIPIAIKASVVMDDLRKYRRGKINERELDKKISFDLFYPDNDSYNYDILSEVFETGLNNIGDEENRKLDIATTYIYLKNYGLLFFLNAKHDFLLYSRDTWPSLVFGYESAAEALREGRSREREASAQNEKNEVFITELRNEIIEIIGQYGHTLDEIQDHESIVILVNMGATFGTRLDSKFAIRMLKKDIVAFNKEKIPLKKLIETARISQY